jgi:hypothetical protein
MGTDSRPAHITKAKGKNTMAKKAAKKAAPKKSSAAKKKK